MKPFHLILISVFLLSANMLSAQQRKAPQNFYVQSRMVAGQPVGKIIPGNQGAWYLGMKHGYTVSVAVSDENGYGVYELVAADLLPAPASAFADPALPPQYADVMRRMIYEETFASPGKSFDDMLLADKVMGRMYYSYLLTSSYDAQLSVLSGLQFSLPPNLGARYKVKVEINGYPSYTFEQIKLGSEMYSDAQSPVFEIEQGDKLATLLWNHTDYQMMFVAYQVSRSSDGENFESLGTPRVFNGLTAEGKLGMVSFVDTLPSNYSDYWYRVQGYDVFGFLSKPGPDIRMQGKDMTPPKSPMKVSVLQVSPDVVNLTWAHEAVDDLKGFQVIGSMTEQGEYKRLHENILAPSERFFQFNISEYLFRYYRVLAVDTAHNATASDLAYLVVVDTIPPEVPADLRVEVDSNRVVHLSWSPSISEDIKGYRLMKAYHPSHGFVPITPKPVIGLSYIDTVPKQRIDKKVYYQLIALDTHFNHSAPATFVAATIPDDIPPTSPLLTSAKLLDAHNVLLKWKGSSSDDVMSYKLYRTLDGDSAIVEIDLYDPSAEEYSDVDFGERQVQFATYSLVAIDSTGNVSEVSNSKRVFTKKAQAQLSIQIATVSQVETGVKLEWIKNETQSGIVLVYRAKGNGVFDLLARAETGNEYLDSDVKTGVSYKYKIALMESTGRKSPLSDPVSLKVK